jgi:hypothetical protein
LTRTKKGFRICIEDIQSLKEVCFGYSHTGKRVQAWDKLGKYILLPVQQRFRYITGNFSAKTPFYRF